MNRFIATIIASAICLTILYSQNATEIVKKADDKVRSENSAVKYRTGGELQCVAFAKALASNPKFVLADEPTANLDSKSTENLLEILEKLNREENIIFIFSTHDSWVLQKARRIIPLEDGKVLSDVTTR